MKLSRIKFLLFDKMLLIYSSTRAAHTTRLAPHSCKYFFPCQRLSVHQSQWTWCWFHEHNKCSNCSTVSECSRPLYLVARTHEVVTDGSHHHYGNRVSSIDSLLPRRRLDEVWTCRVGTDEMSSTKARTEVMLHRSAVGFRLQICPTGRQTARGRRSRAGRLHRQRGRRKA